MALTVLYQYHKEEWYLYHSDLSQYGSDCTVSVSQRRGISLSQWFITLWLWLLYQYHKEEWYLYHSDLSHYGSDYCISITKESDTSITVIYHTMALTVLYQYHKEEWYLYHSDLSHYDCTVCWNGICLLLSKVSLTDDQYMVILFLLFLFQFSMACLCLAVNDGQRDYLAKQAWHAASESSQQAVQIKYNCCGFSDPLTGSHPTCEKVCSCKPHTTVNLGIIIIKEFQGTKG